MNTAENSLNKVACIGSRETPDDVIESMERIGKWLVTNGFVVSSGNALGADAAFARGANSVDPKKVRLYLPWKYMNEEITVKGNVCEIWGKITENDETLSEVRYGFKDLKESVKALHRRNYGIVKDSVCVVCWTKYGKDIGGTAIGMRLAKKFGIPIFNLFNENAESELYEYLKKRMENDILSNGHQRLIFQKVLSKQDFSP